MSSTSGAGEGYDAPGRPSIGERHEYTLGYRLWLLGYAVSDRELRKPGSWYHTPGSVARVGRSGRHTYPGREGIPYDRRPSIDRDAVPRLREVLWRTERVMLPSSPMLWSLSRGSFWEPVGEIAIPCSPDARMDTKNQCPGRPSPESAAGLGGPPEGPSFSISGCSCGFYAFHSVPDLLGGAPVGRADKGEPLYVAGIIRCRGSIIPAKRGFRAEKAEIVALLDMGSIASGSSEVRQMLADEEGNGPSRFALERLAEFYPEREVLEETATTYNVPVLSGEEVPPFRSLAGRSIPEMVGRRPGGAMAPPMPMPGYSPPGYPDCFVRAITSTGALATFNQQVSDLFASEIWLYICAQIACGIAAVTHWKRWRVNASSRSLKAHRVFLRAEKTLLIMALVLCSLGIISFLAGVESSTPDPQFGS